MKKKFQWLLFVFSIMASISAFAVIQADDFSESNFSSALKAVFKDRAPFELSNDGKQATIFAFLASKALESNDMQFRTKKNTYQIIVPPEKKGEVAQNLKYYEAIGFLPNLWVISGEEDMNKIMWKFKLFGPDVFPGFPDIEFEVEEVPPAAP
ncbi:MAG: hypothetical protein K2W92_07385 [Alphaproteobacteria bacterium]|nr:hypothetical protein [Alphaproteobacteria bacterium]